MEARQQLFGGARKASACLQMSSILRMQGGRGFFDNFGPESPIQLARWNGMDCMCHADHNCEILVLWPRIKGYISILNLEQKDASSDRGEKESV